VSYERRECYKCPSHGGTKGLISSMTGEKTTSNCGTFTYLNSFVICPACNGHCVIYTYIAWPRHGAQDMPVYDYINSYAEERADKLNREATFDRTIDDDVRKHVHEGITTLEALNTIKKDFKDDKAKYLDSIAKWEYISLLDKKIRKQEIKIKYAARPSLEDIVRTRSKQQAQNNTETSAPDPKQAQNNTETFSIFDVEPDYDPKQTKNGKNIFEIVTSIIFICLGLLMFWGEEGWLSFFGFFGASFFFLSLIAIIKSTLDDANI
jgi:hypothetical protein